MQLGFVSAILPDVPLEGVLRFAADEQFDCVELMCWPLGKADRRYAGVTHVDVSTLDEPTVKRIRGLSGDCGVSISALGYYPNLLTPDALEATTCAEHLVKVIHAAARLGVGRVNSFVGRNWTKTIDANWSRFLDVWRPLVALAESLQVRIGIEN